VLFCSIFSFHFVVGFDEVFCIIHPFCFFSGVSWVIQSATPVGCWWGFVLRLFLSFLGPLNPEKGEGSRWWVFGRGWDTRFCLGAPGRVLFLSAWVAGAFLIGQWFLLWFVFTGGGVVFSDFDGGVVLRFLAVWGVALHLGSFPCFFFCWGCPFPSSF